MDRGRGVGDSVLSGWARIVGERGGEFGLCLVIVAG